MSDRLLSFVRATPITAMDAHPGSLLSATDMLRSEIDLLAKELETLAQQVAPISVDRPTKTPPEAEEKNGLSSPLASEVRNLAVTIRALRARLVGIITQIDL